MVPRVGHLSIRSGVLKQVIARRWYPIWMSHLASALPGAMRLWYLHCKSELLFTAPSHHGFARLHIQRAIIFLFFLACIILRRIAADCKCII